MKTLKKLLFIIMAVAVLASAGIWCTGCGK